MWLLMITTERITIMKLQHATRYSAGRERTTVRTPKADRMAERAIAATNGAGAAYTVRGATYGDRSGWGDHAQTAERIRRDAARGIPWQPYRAS
jgi:hypothetical protein